ncbi:MAG TPA: sensor histidine kinase [Phenylobacterium sp.]|jgi:two-component sensor histidine kinase|uniref:sensor histidine kinase n=1 Tax=Phenylobacterium sp. TaxID=1871053 RepID=UPI002D625D9A|nr:sensor histidine kinase [Phenylobacterium sp.]HZZ68621.1 sensor histidine kinase [Phenylobacterium sp.]
MRQPPDEGSAGADPDAPDRASDRALEAALADKTALLHEVDHRVKNNLQLIASLILLQSRRTADENARMALKTVLERVTAVATVHRRLFQGDPLRFDVADFVRDLAGDLAAAAGRNDLTIALELDPVAIPASAAAPFALVVNELLGNSLKHAFPAGRAGRIRVALSNGGERCRLTVSDDGVGRQGQPAGFGSTIVQLLCQQLHAELDISDAQPGVLAVVTVPMSLPATPLRTTP